MPNQQQFNLPYQQNNQQLYHNMHFQYSHPPYQHTQPQFYQNVANMQLPAQSYTNHAFNNNLWETVKRLQDKEKTWEEEKKLLLLQIEGMRSSQNTGMGNEVQREDKNQGKIDDYFCKRSLQGQLPTKPCINPRNLLHVDRSNCFSYTSNAEISNNQKSDSSYNLSRNGTSINDISALRSGRILSNSEDIQRKDIENNKLRIEDKLEDRELIPEKEELNREGKEHMIPFPSALVSKNEKIDNSSLLEVLKNTSITIPLTDANRYIPLYGNFVKELCTPSRERRKIKLYENISSIILNSLPEKLQDPGTPVIGCTIQNMEFKRVLLDTGASVNILPKLLYDKLSLVALEPIKLELQLVDGSVRAPYGRLEDGIVIVGDLAFPVNFIVTDVKVLEHYAMLQSYWEDHFLLLLEQSLN